MGKTNENEMRRPHKKVNRNCCTLFSRFNLEVMEGTFYEMGPALNIKILNDV